MQNSPTTNTRKNLLPLQNQQQRTENQQAKRPRLAAAAPAPVELPSWNDMVVQYIQYQAKHKDPAADSNKKYVPVEIGTDDVLLANFVQKQRNQFNTKVFAPASDPWALNADRVLTLNFVDFKWPCVAKRQSPHHSQQYNQLWNDRFAQLVAWKKKHGHTNVPQALLPLGKWVKTQREAKQESDRKRTQGPAYKKKSTICLSQERINKLNSIGFQWRLRSPLVSWEERYQQLIEYKRVHGDTLVPQVYPEDKTFGKWVMKQRCEYSQLKRGLKSLITEERIRKLNEIGFYWVSPRFNKPKKAPPPPPPPPPLPGAPSDNNQQQHQSEDDAWQGTPGFL